MGMLYPADISTRPFLAKMLMTLPIYISAWASALLVSTTGRCQSLYAWDE